MLIFIFLLALVIRFLYFPDNIYFGYDQARDAFNALSIFHGDIKIIGPSTTFEGLNHGVLHWYILAPFYGLFKNPEIVAIAFRGFNALGVFLIFYLGKILFDRKVGLIAAILYAASFEQSQFAIYIGNPTLGSLSVPLMYLGLALVIFAKKAWGLPLAFLGLGFSIQFQFALFYLIVPFILILIFYKKYFLNLSLKIWGLSSLAIFFALSTFILAELKYQFRTISALLKMVTQVSDKNFNNIFSTYFFEITQIIKYNLTGNLVINNLVGLILLGTLIFYFIKREFREKLKFLSIWFFSLFIIFYMGGGVEEPWRNIPLYYPNVGISMVLLLFVAFLLNKLKFKIIIIFLIVLMNLQLIKDLNHRGSMAEIDVQQGMLLSDEKKILDYMYQDAKGEPFVVKAVTMPFDINTTWSYLFEYYGNKIYGYMPLWNGKTAEGYPGNLAIQEAQEGLPSKRYVIIEPLRGVPEYLMNDFMRTENYFTNIINEKRIGLFIIQSRKKY